MLRILVCESGVFLGNDARRIVGSLACRSLPNFECEKYEVEIPCGRNHSATFSTYSGSQGEVSKWPVKTEVGPKIWNFGKDDYDVYHNGAKGVMGGFRHTVGRPRASLILKDKHARKVLSKVEELSATQIATALDVCKKGLYVHKELFSAISDRICQSQNFVEEFNSVQMSILIHALGVLWRNANFPREFFPGFDTMVSTLVYDCLKRVQLGYADFNGQSIANIMHGLGWLFKNDVGNAVRKNRDVDSLMHHLINEFCQADRLKDCFPQSMICILHACANLNYKNSRELTPICDEISKRLQPVVGGIQFDFIYQEIALIVWALGKLLLKHEIVIDRITPAIITNLGSFDVRHISNILHGLAQLQYDKNGILDALGNEISKDARLMQANPQELSNMMKSLGLLRYRNLDVIDALCDEVCESKRLHAFSEQGLANVLYGLGKLKYNRTDVVESLTVEILKEARLHAMSTQELAKVIYSVGELGHKRWTLLDRLGYEACKMERLHEFLPRHLAMIIHAFAKLGYDNKAVLEPVVGEIRRTRRMKSFNTLDLVLIKNGLGKVKYGDLGVLEEVTKRYELAGGDASSDCSSVLLFN